MEKIEKKIKELIKEIEHLAKRFDSIGSFYSLRYEINKLGDNELTINRREYIEESSLDNIEKLDINLDSSLPIQELEFSEEEKNDLLTNNYDDGVYEFREESLKNLNDTWYNYADEVTELLYDNFNRLRDYTYGLIDLLDKDSQKEYKDKLLKINIEFIQKKKYITVRELTKIYNMSPETQKRRRARIHDTLPSIQVAEGCKIMYNVEEVDIWLENERIKDESKKLKKKLKEEEEKEKRLKLKLKEKELKNEKMTENIKN